MKRLLGLFVCYLAIAVPDAGAQTQRGSWELAAACNLGSMSTSHEYSAGGETHSESGDAIGYFALDLRTGVYVVDGLSIEPEVYMLAVEKDPPAFNLGANLAYAFDIPESMVKPFVTIGYGIGNAAPMMQRLLGRASDKMDIPVLRVGGGLKVFVSTCVALTTEYRYERYTQERTSSYYGSYSYTSKTTSNYHNFLFGFAVFFAAGT
jgi:opacity protein-like surface antigen